MDIASRLKIFMDYINIPVTKLADNCNIPRPSMTQLLKGRNKKVSDEVISKIHAAYPQLSVMWLLFGEGEMVIDGNIEISEPQNDVEDEVYDKNHVEDEDDSEEERNLFSDFNSVTNRSQPGKQHIQRENSVQEVQAHRTVGASGAPTMNVSVNVDSTRRVVNIMVFYSDMSFETFVPESRVQAHSI